jgi:uncharacterized protein
MGILVSGAGLIDGPSFDKRHVVFRLKVESLLPILRVSGDGRRVEECFSMANWSDPRMTAGAAAATVGTRDAAYDAGLRSYMLSVYNYMASAVLLTGIVAMLFAPYARDVLISESGRGMSGLGWVVALAPLGFVLVMNFGLNKLSTPALKACFWAFAAVMGLSMSTIFLAYTGTSIAQAFFATSAAFAGLSLYGYTTKRDLSGMGSFLIMGVVGLIVASLLNLWLQSGVMAMAISAIGVLIFAGLMAYDTQRIKSMYAYVAGTDMVGKTVVMGALSLYLDFINMFQFLLSFMGSRD